MEVPDEELVVLADVLLDFLAEVDFPLDAAVKFVEVLVVDGVMATMVDFALFGVAKVSIESTEIRAADLLDRFVLVLGALLLLGSGKPTPYTIH